MAGSMITSDELNQFKSISDKKKVDSMELYLIGANGYKHNMQEVAAKVFGGENYSYTVSLIHRCYSFTGQNGGKYRNGCKFEQTYGYQVTRKDIEAFVKKYPNGTFNNCISFEDFLKTRVSSAKSASPNPPRQSVQTAPKQKQKVQRPESPQYNYQNTRSSNSSDDPMLNEHVKLMIIAIGGIAVLILLVMLITGNLFRHWIISLIVFFLIIGAFEYLKQM